MKLLIIYGGAGSYVGEVYRQLLLQDNFQKVTKVTTAPSKKNSSLVRISTFDFTQRVFNGDIIDVEEGIFPVGIDKNLLSKEKVNVLLSTPTQAEFLSESFEGEVFIFRIFMNEKERVKRLINAGVGIDEVYKQITSERAENYGLHPKNVKINVEKDKDVQNALETILSIVS